MKMFSLVYEAECEVSSTKTGAVLVGSFPYDGWSFKLCETISEMTFQYFDQNWGLGSFSLSFLATKEISKNALGHV